MLHPQEVYKSEPTSLLWQTEPSSFGRTADAGVLKYWADSRPQKGMLLPRLETGNEWFKWWGGETHCWKSSGWKFSGSTEESTVQELSWTQEPGAISAMLCVLEMMRWRGIFEGCSDESSQDPLKNQQPSSLHGHKNLGPSLLCCASLGETSDA